MIRDIITLLAASLAVIAMIAILLATANQGLRCTDTIALIQDCRQ